MLVVWHRSDARARPVPGKQRQQDAEQKQECLEQRYGMHVVYIRRIVRESASITFVLCSKLASRCTCACSG
jgi:hypothetical protein